DAGTGYLPHRSRVGPPRLQAREFGLGLEQHLSRGELRVAERAKELGRALLGGLLLSVQELVVSQSVRILRRRLHFHFSPLAGACASRSMNCARALCSHTLTVARFRPVSSAISCVDIPSISNMMNVSRYFGDISSRMRYALASARRCSRLSMGVGPEKASSSTGARKRRSHWRRRCFRRCACTIRCVIPKSHVVGFTSLRSVARRR